MLSKLKEVFNQFDVKGSFDEAAPVGSGHIHETYLVKTSEADCEDYILQKLNNNVFRNIPELQENIERITEHIRKKVSSVKGSDPDREALRLIKSHNGKSWITDSEGSFWRMMVYIRGTKSYDIVDSTSKAYEGGRAIGRFQTMLSDLPDPALHETIPGFHDIEKRIVRFSQVVADDIAGRVSESAGEIAFFSQRADDMRLIHKLGREGKIPVRITHNDTKFNNILFDENDKPLCLIDLDTVMPGYFHSDFGDAIRTAANKAAEDETDLSKVKMDISLFKAYAEGYLHEADRMLNEHEKKYLFLTPIIITYEQALRFLTDYLEGDIYYKIHKPLHNLERTRAQMALVISMEEQAAEMENAISDILKKK